MRALERQGAIDPADLCHASEACHAGAPECVIQQLEIGHD
jgi:hypothetical protein